MASARIQRWALTLSAYDYHIKYKAGLDNANADLLSRLPLPATPCVIPEPGETVLLMETLDSSAVTSAQIRTWTNGDPVLARVRDMVLQGWVHNNDKEYAPYQAHQSELTVLNGCVLRGNRVIVPPVGRAKMFDELHESHPGMCKMKSLARSYVWWPGIDHDVEEKVRACNVCQQTRPQNPPVTIHPWEWPKRPWSRLHLDYAGPISGKMFLVLIDAYSKWLDVKVVNSATSSATIEHLRSIFSVQGLPETIVTDNGTVFTSAEFENFTKLNGIRHIRTAPYHPASNGQAERAVKIFKEYLKKSSKDSLETQISRFLFRYRITPHSTTAVSPAELLLGRRPRSHLDFVRPHLEQQVQDKQLAQQANRGGRVAKEFADGSLVFAKNFAVTGPRWLSGTISRSCGPRSYLITLTDGRSIRRHVNHLRKQSPQVSSDDSDRWMTRDDPDEWMDILPTAAAVAQQPARRGTASQQPHGPPRRSTRGSYKPGWYGNPVSY